MLKNSAKSEHQISVSSPRCTCAYEPHISRPTMSPKNWPDGDRRKSRCPQTPGAASPRFSSKDERLGPQYPSHAVTHLGKRILPNGGGSCLSDLEPTRLPERPPPPAQHTHRALEDAAVPSWALAPHRVGAVPGVEHAVLMRGPRRVRRSKAEGTSPPNAGAGNVSEARNLRLAGSLAGHQPTRVSS